VTGPQRERLAAAQADLLRALLTNAAPPAGFDPERLRVEANALRSKRRGVVAMLQPDACVALADRFIPLFNEFARDHPKSTTTRARQDALDFVAWLYAQGHLAKPRWWRRRRTTQATRR
jgi:hypothetical protein